MAKGYWIVDLEMTDPEAYQVYVGFVRPFMAANGGRFIVRGGQQRVVEGTFLPRAVVIEFESFERALEVYHSEEYQRGKQLRSGASHGNVSIVEGFDG